MVCKFLFSPFLSTFQKKTKNKQNSNKNYKFGNLILRGVYFPGGFFTDGGCFSGGGTPSCPFGDDMTLHSPWVQA